MKLSTSFNSLLLAFTAVAAVDAAPVPPPASGDLFVGFRVSGGIGGSTSYLVKLGNDASFLTTPGTSLQIGTFGADLKSIYGDDWATRADLFWGVFGERLNSGNPIVYGSKERLTPGEATTPWPALDLTARNSVDSQITSVLQGQGGYSGREATTNSAVATTQPNSSSTSSYAFQVATAGTTDFGSLSQWGSIEGDFGSGAAGTVLDLWRIAPSGVTQRGSFFIDGNGLITYAVVPEPSSAVLFGVGAVLLGIRPRRKSAHAAAKN